jgi:hypothetical protein
MILRIVPQHPNIKTAVNSGILIFPIISGNVRTLVYRQRWMSFLSTRGLNAVYITNKKWYTWLVG